MFTSLSAIVVGGIIHNLTVAADSGASSSPPNPTDSIVLYVLVGLGAALITFFGQLLLRRQEKNKLIAEASDAVATGAKEMLGEYRETLTNMREDITRMRERIAALEAQLGTAKEQRDRIEQERRTALEEVARMQQRVDTLERQIRELERALGGKADTVRSSRREDPEDPWHHSQTPD